MKKLVLTLAVLVGVSALTGCSAASSTGGIFGETPLEGGVSSTDPREGWVVVAEKDRSQNGTMGTISVFKRCDGSTLMYVSTSNNYNAHSISTVPQSLECLE